MEAMDSPGSVVNAGPSEPPPATLTVAAVARRLGVAPPTLRTWDRRYGLGPSAHTAGAHRRYSPADVARLMVMRRLTLEGVSPADAAKIALATAVSDDGRPMHTPADGYPVQSSSLGDLGLASPPDSKDGFGPVSRTPDLPQVTEPEQAAEDVLRLDWEPAGEPDPEPGPEPDEVTAGAAPDWNGVLRSVPSERSTPGGGRVVALPDGTPQTRGLARAAMALDTYEVHRILTDAARREGVVSSWTNLIMPVLRALGERTRVTGDGIDVEHAFSEVVLAVLRAVTFSTDSPSNAPVVLLACADADYHSLPLHALAAALAERDVPTRMIGSGLPPHALSASVRRTGPSVVVLFARMPGADARDTEALRRQRPAPTVVLAGPGWQPESIPPAARTAASLTEAIAEVQRVVRP